MEEIHDILSYFQSLFNLFARRNFRSVTMLPTVPILLQKKIEGKSEIFPIELKLLLGTDLIRVKSKS